MKATEKNWFFSFESRNGGIGLSPNGRVLLCDEVGSIRQSVMLILSTMPGERIMRPDYGCELHRILFLPNDFSTAGLAKYYIEKALTRWEKRIVIRQIDVRSESSPNHSSQINIQLNYEIPSLRASDDIGFSINLSGGVTNAD